MSRKKVEGYCRLCGDFKKLSYEHVPPEAAYNDYPRVAKALDRLLELNDPKKVKGKVFQRGAGGYTLCEQCNSKTGSWYGRRYVEWVEQGMELLKAANYAPSLVYHFRIVPLPVIKQIVCMFLSVNSQEFRNKNLELVRFVWNRSRRYLPDGVRIFTFYAVGTSARQTALSGMIRLEGYNRITTFSEVSFPPFGYVLVFDTPPPHLEMVDISYFARFSDYELSRITLKLPVFPMLSYFPGDFKTKREIDALNTANG